MLAEFSVAPLDKGGKKLSLYVAPLIRIIEKSGLDYQLTAMGTIIEGPCEQIFDLIKQCHMAMTDVSDRVSTSIKIDDRKGAEGTLQKKVSAIHSLIKET